MESLRGENIKYLVIELVKKDPNATEADKIEVGLFKGIRELEYEVEGEVNAIINQEFLLVTPPKEKVANAKLDDEQFMEAFSLDIYNVLSFEAFDGAVRHIIFLKCDEQDQEAGMKIIRAMMLKMSEAKRMTSSEGIIDVNTYSELPESFQDSLRNCVGSINRGTTQASSANTYRAPGAVGANTAVNNAYSSTARGTDYYVKKPFFLKRKTDKPKVSFIKEMSLLLDKLSDNDYIDKPFKVVAKDTDDKAHASDIPKAGTIGTEIPDDDNDYVGHNWVGGCC